MFHPDRLFIYTEGAMKNGGEVVQNSHPLF